MSIERFEIRLACALGIAIYVHLTCDIWHGLFTLGGITACGAYAYMPVWINRMDEREKQRMRDSH